MSLSCQSRTNIVQHVLTLTLCRHYSSPPKPRNLSSSAILKRPEVLVEDVSGRNGGDQAHVFARDRGERDARLPNWLLELQASSSRSLPLQLVPLGASVGPDIPNGSPRRRGRRKRPLIPIPVLPNPSFATLRTGQQLVTNLAPQNESTISQTLNEEFGYEATPKLSGAVDVPKLISPSASHVPPLPTPVTAPSHRPISEAILPRPPRTGSPAAELQTLLGSRIPHTRSLLERHIGDILNSTSTLPLDLPSLRKLSMDYMELLKVLLPNNAPGVWSQRTSYVHRSLREISIAHFNVLQEIRGRGALRPSGRLVKSFTPLLISLIIKPDLRPSSTLPNCWRQVNLVKAVETILDLGLDLTRFQLSLIMRYMGGHGAIRSSERCTTRKGREGSHVNEDTIMWTWNLRRRLFGILNLTRFSTLEKEAFRAELTMSTIMDANVIGLDTVAAYPELKAGLTDAMLYRDANLQSWIDLSQSRDLVPARSDKADTESTDNWNARMALLRVLLQQYLLSPKLRARSPLSSSPEAIPPHPGHILQRMIQQLGDQNAPSSTRSTVYLCSAIFSLRNRYMKEGHFYKLVNLIRHLGRPTTKSPPLPGSVTASLISATRTPTDMATLLVLLYRLPSPTTPVRFRRLWRRSLTKMAMIADKNHIPFSSISAADTEAKTIWDESGWEGLFKSALMRWGYGYSMTQHAVMLLDQAQGRKKALGNQMKKRAKRVRKAFKSTAYDSKAMTFPMMEPPSALDLDVKDLDVKERSKSKGKGARDLYPS